MNPLDAAYREILHHGLLEIRNAADRGDLEHCREASEHLHNVPSLIEEPNRQRHLHQITYHRRRYLDWIRLKNDKDATDWVKRLYVPAWLVIDKELGLESET
jgi:hypothetical protein